jgi:hypothetical protein
MNILVPSLDAKNFLAGFLQNATNAQRIDWHNTSARTQNEIAADFTTLNGLILMAAWGGFESFVEDFCRAALMMDRSLLESPPLKGMKISPSLLRLDAEQQAELVLRDAFNNTKADLKVGVGKFEAQLRFVSLDDSVAQATSEELRDRNFLCSAVS